ESSRLRHAWQRANDEGAHQIEDGAIRANAQRQRDHGNQREARILHQHSRAVAQVLPKLFKPAHPASVAAPLLRLLYDAESLASGVARLFRTHPKPYVLFNLPLDVIAQLLVEFALHL